MVALRRFDHRTTIVIAQAPVSDDRVKGLMLLLFDGIMRGDRGHRFVPCRFQDRTLQLDHIWFVIHTKDLGHLSPENARSTALYAGAILQ